MRRAVIAGIAVLLAVVVPAPGIVHADPTPSPAPSPGVPDITSLIPGLSIPGMPSSGTSSPAAPSTAAAPTGTGSAPVGVAGLSEADVSADVCAAQQPEPGLRPVAAAAPTAPPEGTRQLIPGSDNFGIDNLLRTAAKIGGLEKELPPEGVEMFQGIRVFDPTIQGGGTYNSKTSLQSGLACSIIDSLLKRKVRRDVAQKLALAVVSIPTLLAGLEGPDLARAATNGSACAIALAQAAVQAAIAGGASQGMGAAAAAPAAIAAAPSCVAAAGAIAVIIGKMVNIYEHNPAFPQLIEFSEILNPDSPIGKEVYESTVAKFPVLGQSAELRGLFKALSRFTLKLSEVYFGKSIVVFGNAVADAAAGKTGSVPAAVVAAIELAIQFFSAVMYTLTGSDTFTIGGETMLDTKQLSKQLSAVATGELVRFKDEGTEVVAGGGLGATNGTSQNLVQANLGCLLGQGSGPSGISSQMLAGYNQQATTQTALSQSLAQQPVQGQTTTGIPAVSALQQQALTPGAGQQGALPPAQGGPVLMAAQLPTSKQCTNNAPFTLDKTQTLSQADFDQLKALGLQPAKDPKKAPDGALFGLDANDPNSPLSKIPFLGSAGGSGFSVPGIDLPGIGRPAAPAGASAGGR